MALNLKFLNEGDRFSLTAHTVLQKALLCGETVSIQRVSYFKIGQDSDVILTKRMLTVTVEQPNKFLWGFLEETASGGYIPYFWREIARGETSEATLLRLNFATITWETGSILVGDSINHFHEIEHIVDEVWTLYKNEELLSKLERIEKNKALIAIDDLIQHIQNFRNNIAAQNYTNALT